MNHGGISESNNFSVLSGDITTVGPKLLNKLKERLQVNYQLAPAVAAMFKL